MPDVLTSLRSSEFARYYNLQGLSDVFLTLDVDWAPEYAIEAVLREIEKRKLKVTIFATGPSAILSNPPAWLEVGLHPDFTRKSGPWFDERVALLKEMYPRAVGMRSHRNFFGQNIADIAKANGLKYDASVIQFGHTLLQASRDYNDMVRLPYFWEDGIHLDMKKPMTLDFIEKDAPGLKIFNAHPILLYLNSVTDDHRRSVTSRYKDLTQAPKAEVDPCRNSSKGIFDLWASLLDSLQERNIRTHCLADVL